MNSLAYKEEYRREEVLNGEIVLMSPSQNVNHNRIARNITTIFSNYLKGNRCEVFQDNIDLHLSEKDIFIPDMMVVCDSSIIRDNGVYGTPSLVLEILSQETAKTDRGYKRETYEKYGVKEYWIVSQEEMSLEVNILKEGKYKIENIYYRDNKESFKCSLFEDLNINIEDIFESVVRY